MNVALWAEIRRLAEELCSDFGQSLSELDYQRMLAELMDEIGVDAARWYLVSRGHDQTIEIDVETAGPALLLVNQTYFRSWVARSAQRAPPSTRAGSRTPSRSARPARS